MVSWKQEKGILLAYINGIAVAQATAGEFSSYFLVTILMPYTGEQKRFNTLQEAGSWVAVHVETIIKILSK